MSGILVESSSNAFYTSCNRVLAFDANSGIDLCFKCVNWAHNQIIGRYVTKAQENASKRFHVCMIQNRVKSNSIGNIVQYFMDDMGVESIVGEISVPDRTAITRPIMMEHSSACGNITTLCR